MQNKNWLVSAALLLSSLLTPYLTHAITQNEIKKIAQDAYIYGYPLVTFDLTRQVVTNIDKPTDKNGRLMAPINQIVSAKEFLDSSFKDVVAPNNDTLYSSAWFDLEKEPYVLTIPNTDSRYYLLAVLDAWTNIAASIGSRTTGTGKQLYLISGPNWNGKVPNGMVNVKLSTNLAWLLNRVYSDGSKEDLDKVHVMQSKISVVPLSSYGKSYIFPKGKIDKTIDTRTPVVAQVNSMSAEKFFQSMANLMQSNMPTQADQNIVKEMAAIGIAPGKPFKPTDTVKNAIKNIPSEALKYIAAGESKDAVAANGWSYYSGLGKYGTNYNLRAFATLIGFGANLPDDAAYPVTKVDSGNKTLSGSNSYKVHFEKDKLPPAKAFWSLTMYDPEGFFADNKLGRYKLGSADNMQLNSDGSLDIIIQSEEPKDNVSNWLPAPKGDFWLMLRIYWPEKSFFDGTWIMPPVLRQN